MYKKNLKFAYHFKNVISSTTVEGAFFDKIEIRNQNLVIKIEKTKI